MKKLQWNMKEVFYFPENVGVPIDVRLVKVKAGFTEKRSDDAVRLSGIYHIAAKVDFTEGQRSEAIPEDAIFVDDVELDGETGYFEYAVPLYIDLPPEVEQPLHLEATNVKSTFDGQGSFTVAWNVNCMYGQASSDEATSKTPDSKESPRMEANKEAEMLEEKMETVEIQDSSTETTIAAEKQEQVTEVPERRQAVVAQKRKVAAPVQEPQATAMHDNSPMNGQDDILSYIAALPDEWTTTRFRSNDIFVKEES